MNAQTGTLDDSRQGGANAAAELLPLVYDELRRLAAHKLACGLPGNTLQATALVHEAWLRLVGRQSDPRFQCRTHFFAAAAEAMRHILIDRARRKQAVRHGGGQARVSLDEVEIAVPVCDDEMLEVNEALERLASVDPEKANLVKLRYFAGMSLAEAGAALGISEPTAKRWWSYARAWLFHEIRTRAQAEAARRDSKSNAEQLRKVQSPHLEEPD